MPIIAYIGLGSNMGDRKNRCLQALDLLGRVGRVTNVSSLYCTEPMDYPDQEDFINAVAEFETDLSPEQLLATCRTIEDQLERRRTLRRGPRTIDLDILLYGDLVVETPELVIPHPLLATRRFALIPLCEIAPQVQHPVLKKSVSLLLRELKDASRVEPC